MTARTTAALAAALLALPLAGCGINDPLSNPEFPHDTTPAPVSDAPAAATEVGERYAVAARSFTAATLATNYQLQLQLAGGQLRRELRRVGPPKAAERDALRAAKARTTATVDETRTVSNQPGRITLEIKLEERAVETGAITSTKTTNTAALTLTDGHWHVEAFTAQP